jgi:COP9 signalosome complex subunit 5
MAASASSASSPIPIEDSVADECFQYDEKDTEALKKKCMQIMSGSNKCKDLDEAKMFKNVRMAPLAAMKMLKHASHGVKMGQRSGGLSLEVMGLMIGKAEGSTITINDVFPFNILGEENFVNVDFSAFIPVQDSMESCRKERFIGWYHSHPFDVGEHDNCFLSTTDVQTQMNYQFAVTPFWTAVVVDPKRSVLKGRPIMRAFKTFPGSFDVPKDHAPNGLSLAREEALKRNWGPSPNRYYELPIEFFLSSAVRRLTDSISRDSLWIRSLSSAPTLESDFRQKLPERINMAVDQIKKDDAYRGSSFSHHKERSSKDKHTSLKAGVAALSKLAIEESAGHAGQIAKDILFNTPAPMATSAASKS